MDYYLETEVRGFLEPRVMTEYTSSKINFNVLDEENLQNRMKESKSIRPRANHNLMTSPLGSSNGKANGDSFSIDDRLKLKLQSVDSDTSESDIQREGRFSLSCPFKKLPPHPNSNKPNLIRLKNIISKVQNKHKASDNIERIHKLQDSILFEGSDRRMQEEQKARTLSGNNFLWYIWDLWIFIVYIYDFYMLVNW